ncbi:MAG: glycosyltransferase, partial [Acidobacteriota bacterium]
RYEDHLSFWRSEPDGGQANAIATGLGMATGQIYCWLNSDDILLPGALRAIGALFKRHPRVDFFFGNRLLIDEGGAVIGWHMWPWRLTRAHWALGQSLAQEACFWTRRIYEEVGGINPEKFFIMDYDLFFRMWRKGRFQKTAQFLGCLRQHDQTKNSQHADVWKRELAEATATYGLREPGYMASRLLNRTDRLELAVERWLAKGQWEQVQKIGLQWRVLNHR